MALFKRKKKDKENKKVEEKTTKVDVSKEASSASSGQAKKQAPPKKTMKELYGEKEIETAQKDDKGKPASVPSDSGLRRGKEVKKIRKYGDAYRVLVKPLITEKATILGAENKYIFAVSKNSNKIEIARAINEVYGVKPVSVNIIKVKGKNVRYGRTQGKQKDWKKAIIKLPEGKTIKVYEGV